MKRRIKGVKTPLYQFQAEGVQFIEEHNHRVLIADEMGLGKTIQALASAKRLTGSRPILVVCPGGLKFNWEREAKRHVGMRAEVLESRKAPRRALVKHDLYIINYDIIQYWVEFLKRLKPKYVIIDECQYIKNRTAKRTKAVLEVCRRVKNILALSGTPATNRPAELWPVVHLLWPHNFRSAHKFHFRYCAPEHTPWGWVYKGATNLKKLHRRLRKAGMLRRLKSNVLDQLPKKQTHVVLTDIEDRSQYHRAQTDFINWLKEHAGQAKANRALRVEKMAKLGYLKRLAGKLKLKYVFEWIDNFLEETDEKLLVFGIHKSILKTLHDRYKGSVIVTGATAMKDRPIAVDKFQKSKKCRLFFGNIQAAGVGLNLTKATAVAFAELGWTPAEHTQAIDRAHRIGQEKTVRAYFLVAKGTIEEMLCKTIQKKHHNLIDMLDGGVGRVDALAISDLVSRILLKEEGS